MYYFIKCILLDYQQKNYSADRTDGMEWTLAEDYCTQTSVSFFLGLTKPNSIWFSFSFQKLNSFVFGLVLVLKN